MITDTLKEYLVRKRFGSVGYSCLIVHFVCGLALTVYIAVLSDNENGKFSCTVDPKSTNVHKKQVDQSCFTKYDQAYNSPLPLYGFVLLSIGSGVLVSVIYSQIVSNRVDEIESSHERQNGGEAESQGQNRRTGASNRVDEIESIHERQNEVQSQGQNRRTVYVFYSYFFHLVIRACLATTFSVLQYTYFYSSGFPFKFNCNYNSTVISCENATASRKRLSGILVCATNSIVTFVIFVEVIYLLRRLAIRNHRHQAGWNVDYEFVTVYFLGKRYDQERGECVPLTSIENDRNQENTIQDSIQLYKTQVLDRCLAPQINYQRNESLDDFYIDVVIDTERATHKFSERMEIYEVYDVYTEVPPTSIRLEKIKDLFHPNEDAKGKVPRSILAIGRPGIGKTVLTEKIIRDWANSIDNYYDNKIALIFKFRWFSGNIEKFTDITLKEFLQLGTSLSDVEFERICKEITKEPQRAILIFDGLDEFYGDYMHCLDESRRKPNNPDTRMSAMNLFVKLVQGNMLKGATVLVTSRPTAEYFYSKLNFDRDVEILGFTRQKIKAYVAKFCKNNNASNLEPMMWQHVESNSELLNLCYIPVNCFIVCVTLSGCLADSKNDSSALPTTLTELYQKAVHYFEKYERHRNENSCQTTEETFKELQALAFHGMEQGRLIFQQKEVSEQMENSCLLNSLPDPAFTIQAEFCFTHLTIQEFLAAKHVTETLDASEVKKFISDRIQSSKWHLVLQFVAGLLGQKIKMSDGELYKDCVLLLANTLKFSNHIIYLVGRNVFLMKCLRELDNENIANEICETTDMNNVRKVSSTPRYKLSPSEWAAVTFVCKHLKNLAELELHEPSADGLQEVEELLQGRCLNTLILRAQNTKLEAGRVFSALTKLNCKLKHSHTKLTTLSLVYRRRAANHFSNIYSFFSSDNASHLKELNLNLQMRSSDVSELCEAFNNNHCTEITELHLSVSRDDKDATAPLWDTLCKGICNLTKLTVSAAISEQCMLKLCNALQDERCQLTDLSLWYNAIDDKGACMLFENGLTQEHCKLTKLDLGGCSLTDKCIPSLCKALQDEHCPLTDLKLVVNKIGDKGACMLFEDGLIQEHCKLTELSLGGCSLTDKCIPRLFNALQDERCRLIKLWLWSNKFTEDGKRSIRKVKENCKERRLMIHF